MNEVRMIEVDGAEWWEAPDGRRVRPHGQRPEGPADGLLPGWRRALHVSALRYSCMAVDTAVAPGAHTLTFAWMPDGLLMVSPATDDPKVLHDRMREALRYLVEHPTALRCMCGLHGEHP